MKKYTLLLLGILLLTLSACEEEKDLFNPDFENTTMSTKEEVLDQLHHFAELATNNISSINLNEDYIPIYNDSFFGETYEIGDTITKNDLETNSLYSEKKIHINALNEFVWNLNDIYDGLENCDFEEAQICETTSLYGTFELSITVEDNQLLLEIEETRLNSGLEEILVLVIYATEVDDELYLAAERYERNLEGYYRQIKYIFYENHYSKEYYTQKLGVDKREGAWMSVVDLTTNTNYNLRVEDITDELYAYSFYNEENDTHYSYNKDISTSLDIYDGDSSTFHYYIGDDIIVQYNLVDVENWDYIEYDHGFPLYKDDNLITNIDINMSKYNVGEIVRTFTGTPSDGQISLNDIGLNYDITMDEINDLIEENETYANELFDTLNIQTTFSDNKDMFENQFTFTYTLDEILAFLNEKVAE